jgi:hypothetical protein
MARSDAKKGRFNADSETTRIFHGISGYQNIYGDYLSYFRLSRGLSDTDPVYGEATGGGRVYTGPYRIPATHVTHIEGQNEYGDKGFYYSDSLSAQISFSSFIACGMTFADIETGNYLNDRVVYDRKLFRVTDLAIRGQIQERDIMVGLDAQQLKPGEVADDPQFAAYATYNPSGLSS